MITAEAGYRGRVALVLASLIAALAFAGGAPAFADQQSGQASSSASTTSTADGTAVVVHKGAWHTSDDGHRYFVDSATGLPVEGFFQVNGKGSWYYGEPQTGYVATGTYPYADGQVLLASSKGKLYAKAGWLESKSYSANKSKQRYYLEPLAGHDGIYVAKTGFFKAKSGGKTYSFYGIPKKGYIARGAYTYKGHVLLASPNAGRLSAKKGWKNSSTYTSGSTVHRYYLECIDAKNGIYAAKTGFFKVGSGKYYGRAKKGFVVRQPYKYSSKLTLVPDAKTGKLYSKSGWLTSKKYSEDSAKHKYHFKEVDGNSGYYAAQVKKFKVSSKSYYGIAGKGYVHQNETFAVPGDRYVADKDGQIKKSQLLYGIDVSSYQQNINLTKVNADFVLIKATEGTTYTNPYWSTMAKQALAKKKLIGFYHYASGGKASNAAKEADYFVKTVKKYIGQAVLVLDWEGDARSSGVKYAKKFLDRVKARTGVTPMIYMSKGDTSYYNWSSVASSYPLWVAQYANYQIMGYVDSPWTDSNGYGAWSGPLMFQYTSTGRVDGYSDNLDLDLFYANSSVWKSYCKAS